MGGGGERKKCERFDAATEVDPWKGNSSMPVNWQG